ncbi:hypothetical protein CN474_32325 [Bacillus thuringiensis]|nr:hypothetical protein CN474_32325 [Bacillus thuringiensis]
MPTCIKSIKDNKKLYKKTTFCLKISLKLMDVWRYPTSINLTPSKQKKPQTFLENKLGLLKQKSIFLTMKTTINFSFFPIY